LTGVGAKPTMRLSHPLETTARAAIAMSQTDFSSLPLQAALVENLATLGYDHMTPIQAQSLPAVLAGKDVIAQGKTGSGKTAAFGLGLLQRLVVHERHIQALVLCPTRELANQVATELRRLGRTIPNIKIITLCGGTPFRPQADSLQHGAHIIVGTPGRMEDHLSRGTLVVDRLKMLVLDEADRMLEMGFQDSLDTIMGYIPAQRQTLLFSATFPPQIQAIAQRVMRDPLMTQVEATHDNTSIQQHLYALGEGMDRPTAVRLLLLHYRPESVLIFCNTKRETQALAGELRRNGFSALALHGDLEQRERDQTLVRFANKSASVLVATDVAARGLDVENVDAVINYHMAHDGAGYVHRIGRTGRAGQQGMACTLYDPAEGYKVDALEAYLGQRINKEPLPPLSLLHSDSYQAAMVTLRIDGGKRQKLRAGDILGALTGDNGIPGQAVGKIQLFDTCAYVAVRREAANAALKKLGEGKLKGRSFRVRRV
jgi:ATP-independent RNA helicase DbpA